MDRAGAAITMVAATSARKTKLGPARAALALRPAKAVIAGGDTVVMPSAALAQRWRTAQVLSTSAAVVYGRLGAQATSRICTLLTAPCASPAFEVSTGAACSERIEMSE